MWAECIRVDPENLNNDEPYNIIIFQPPVSHQCIQSCNFQISNTFSTDEEYAEYLVTNALQMTLALQRIAQYYFNEAEVASPYISVLMEIDYHFNAGCDDLIKLFRAVKNNLQYEICICNTINSCQYIYRFIFSTWWNLSILIAAGLIIQTTKDIDSETQGCDNLKLIPAHPWDVCSASK